MVEGQLITRGIKGAKVLDAFRKVPRHEFVPENLSFAAYDDSALPIGADQTISQPYMVAVMTELLRLKGDEKTLEVGTGSGYQAAILAEICGKVYTIERVARLSQNAKNILDRLGYTNIEFLTGDGSEGCPAAAPYDAIIVTAGCPDIPKPLTDQLAEGGRLVIPVGEMYHQTLTLVVKEQGRLKITESIDCVFVPLLGKFGWNRTSPKI